MDKNERYLSQYQRTNVISYSSSSNENSSSSSKIIIPKMFCNSKTKEEHYEAINKFFDLYLQETHTDKDIKLLHGILSNKEISTSEILNNYIKKGLLFPLISKSPQVDLSQSLVRNPTMISMPLLSSHPQSNSTYLQYPP